MALNVASTSSAQMSYIPEQVMGATPTTGKGRNLRFTGESLQMTVSKETSKEIEASRQTSSMYLTDAQVAGGINIELSAGEYDPFLEALLMDTWSTFGTQGVLDAGSATFATPANTITLTNAATGLEVGMYFSLSGTGINRANAGPHRVKAIDTAKKVITVHTTLEAQTVTAAKVHHSRLTNGTAKRSFSVEKLLAEINQAFLYRGMQVSKGSFPFDMRTAITGSFDFIGTTSETGTGRMLGDKTPYTPSLTNPVIDTVLGMKDVLIDGVPTSQSMSAGLTKLNLDYDNALKGLGAIGVLGNTDVIAGTIVCGGSLEMYLNNTELYQSVLKQTRFRLEWAVYDREGHGYAFILPSVELDAPEAPVSQKDEGVMLTLKFNALKDPTTQKTIFIDRF